jgi:multidrug efflux pump subunit AcrB
MMITILVYLMVQAVVFGFGAVLVLATPLADFAMRLMPFVIVLSLIVSAPISWTLAPMLRARYARRQNAEEPGRSAEI